MNLNPIREFRRWKRRITASGSPFRYIGKFQRTLRNRLLQPALFKKAKEIEQALPSDLAAHVANLRQKGYSYSTGELDPALVAELGAFSEARMSDPDLDTKKTVLRPFMIQLSHRDDLRTDDVLVRFALQDSVVRIAASYLGEVPYLSSVQIFQSLNPGTTNWGESQLWHLDYEDSTTVKLWVYLTDVNEEAQGPFTFLPRDESLKIKNNFFPGRVSDEKMDAQTNRAFVQQVKGPRLTAFYIDSSVCYHMGSRIHPGNSRIVYEATFVTHSSLYPLENGIALNGKDPDLHRQMLVR